MDLRSYLPTTGKNPAHRYGPLIVLVIVSVFFLALAMGFVQPETQMQRRAAYLLLTVGGGLLVYVANVFKGEESA